MTGRMTGRIAELILGLWLIAAPWVLGLSNATLMLWSNTVVGIIIVLLSAWDIMEIIERKKGGI